MFFTNLPDLKYAFSLEVQSKGEQSLSLHFNLAVSTGPCMAVPIWYVLSGCKETLMLWPLF